MSKSRLVRLTAVLGLLLSFVFVANLSAASPTTDIQICVQLQGSRAGAGQGEPGLQWQLRNAAGGAVMYSNTTTTDNAGCFSATGVPGQFYWLWARSADSIAMERQLANPWPTSGTIDLRTAAVGANALVLREGNAFGSDNAINVFDLSVFSPVYGTVNAVGDFDESGGTVNIFDLGVFSPNYGLIGTAGTGTAEKQRLTAPQAGTFTSSTQGFACPTGSIGDRTVPVTMQVDLGTDLANTGQVWFTVSPASAVENVTIASSPFGTQFENAYNTTTGLYRYTGTQLGGNIGSSFNLVFNVVAKGTAPVPSVIAVDFVLAVAGSPDGTQFFTPTFQQVLVTGNNTSVGVVCPSAVGLASINAPANTGVQPLVVALLAASLIGTTVVVARRKRL